MAIGRKKVAGMLEDGEGQEREKTDTTGVND